MGCHRYTQIVMRNVITDKPGARIMFLRKDTTKYATKAVGAANVAQPLEGNSLR
jgi:hypothetical protein